MYDSGLSGVECRNRRGSSSSAARECLFNIRRGTHGRVVVPPGLPTLAA